MSLVYDATLHIVDGAVVPTVSVNTICPLNGFAFTAHDGGDGYDSMGWMATQSESQLLYGAGASLIFPPNEYGQQPTFAVAGQQGDLTDFFLFAADLLPHIPLPPDYIQDLLPISIDGARLYIVAEALPLPPTDLVGDRTPPNAPTFESLTWLAPSSGPAPTSYNVYRDSVLIGSSVGAAFVDANADASTEYSYSVKSVNSSGESSASNTFVAPPAVAGPPIPTGLNSSRTLLAAILQWNISPDATVTGYKLYRDSVLLATISPRSVVDYTDNSVNLFNTYAYTIKAVSPTGESGLSGITYSNESSYVGTPPLPVGTTILLTANQT